MELRPRDKEWFANWFSSPYYPLLYNKRNDQEAEDFIKRLMTHLSLPAESHVLDLACGRGRHSRTLAELGYRVTGIDLSEASILDARALSDGSNPDYAIHDMREPSGKDQYTAILNLFTSFGYFEDPSENLKVLQHAFDALKSQGVLVVDFLNKLQVESSLKATSTEFRGAVKFGIRKEISEGFVHKHIHIEDGGKYEQHIERVQLFSEGDIKNMMEQAGFQVKNIFGNYRLDPFEANSDRLIIIATKG